MNLTKQDTVSTGQTSWIEGYARKSKLFMIYWGYNLIRMMLNLTIQCAYLNFQRFGEQVGELEVTSEFRPRVKWIENLMVNVGQVHRADGAIGIFFYAIYLSNSLTFRIARSLLDKRIVKTFTKDECISFLMKPNDDNEKILKERLHNCLDRIIFSNENFTKKMVKLGPINEVSDLDSSKRLIKKRLILNTQNTIVPHSIYRVTASSVYLSKSSNSKIFNYEEEEGEWREDLSDFEMISAEVELVEALRKQREFLIKLRENIDKSWPAYKNIHSIKRLKRIGSLVYIAYGISGWLIGQFITIVGLNIAYSSLATSSFNLEYRRFTLMDRLTCAEYHIFTYFIMFSYISDFCIYLVTMLYHLQQLRRLWLKTNQFYKEAQRCEMWQQTISNGKYNSIVESNFMLSEQIRRDLKFECDKSIIELYIDYYVFRQGAKSVVEISATATNQIVTFVVIAIIPLLANLNYIPKSHKSTLMVIGLHVVMFCNTPFILCAFFDSACNRFAKNAWSIVAFIAGHNQDLYQFSKTNMSSTSIFRRNIDFSDKSGFDHKVVSGGLPYILTEQSTKRRLPDYVYYSKSYITPHSMMLWHGLVENHPAVSEGFVSKVYGIFKINYGGVLKFNHWLVWAWLVTISTS